MAKLKKRMQKIKNQINAKTKQYDIDSAISILKETSTTRFTESIDIAVNLGINAQKSDQNIRGIAILPHGIGKNIKVAVFAEKDDIKIAKKNGAELVGMEILAEQIKAGKINFDILIASPKTMHIVTPLGKILGPRGLMPNLKTGTITNNIAEAIRNAKKGQIQFRNDKNGIIHSTIGKINFEKEKIIENFKTILTALKKAKPASSKGIYIKKITLSTTMGIGVKIDPTKLFTI